MKIRAAVLEESGRSTPYADSKPLRVQEVDLAPPQTGEVLVKIVAAGICHSDLSVVEGLRPRPLPMVLGHESSGIVEEVGPNVHGLKKGDHVVSIFVANCGFCLPCAEGRPALCEPGAAAGAEGALLGSQRRLSRNGQAINHHSGVSGFAEYATVDQRSLVKVTQEISLQDAALFGCAVMTGVGSAINSAKVQLGSTVAVIGLGGVGLAALLGAIAAGASRVIAIDTSDTKLEFARTLGATDTFNALQDGVVESIRDATRGGVEIVLDMAGAASAMELGYKITRRGGQLVTAGLPPPHAMFSFAPVALVGDEKTIRGSYMGSGVPKRDVPRYIELFRGGKLPIDRLVTHHLPLEDINAGMDRLKQGLAIRQLISMS